MIFLSIDLYSKRMNISPKQLRMFLALSESLNFSKTAEQLFMTQPSLSKVIRDLEATLGLALFERTTRSGRRATGDDCAHHRRRVRSRPAAPAVLGAAGRRAAVDRVLALAGPGGVARSVRGTGADHQRSADHAA